MNYGDKIKIDFKSYVADGIFVRWICNELIEALIEGSPYTIQFKNIVTVH